MDILFENFRLPGNQRKPGQLYLTVCDGKILDLSIYPPIKNIETVIDCKGCYLSPGLLDLQLYGAGGFLFSQGFAEQDFKVIDRLHLLAGTTRYLITVPSLQHEEILKAIEVTKEMMADESLGCLGLHLEGPWINSEQKGSHDPKIIRRPDLQKLQEIVTLGKRVIKLITIAPEQFSSTELDWLLATGIPVAAGHSNASVRDAKQFFDRGVRLSTHLYNAMSGMHHRSPGLTGATLLDDRVYATLIADGNHVDYSMIALAQRLKRDRLILISDATFYAATESTLYFRDQEINKKDGAFRNREGRLMGSSIALLDAVRNMVRYVQTPIPEALKMASTYPARYLGETAYGQLAKDKIADLLLLDEQLVVQQIFRAGKSIKLI